MNNIATPSDYYYGAIEQSTYPPLVPVQLFIWHHQRTAPPHTQKLLIMNILHPKSKVVVNFRAYLGLASE